MSRLRFDLLTRDGAARRGRLAFPRGTVETPAFMPVGTYGTVKGMLPDQVRALGAEIILGNTFHLYLRPGLEVIGAHGGLHGFARWDGPILTDSGGFQVFSLAHKRRITEAGVTFAAPSDGSKVFLGPEESMHIQKVLGSDIVMIFDECPPVQVDGRPVDKDVVDRSMELSLRWAERSKRAHEGNDAALFGIVQGGVHHDLRSRSADGLKAIGFDGYAIGGLAVGETEDERNAMLDHTCPQLPGDRPRYLMGVGRPEDLVEAVARGLPGPKVVSLVDGTKAAGLDLARLQDMGFSVCLFAITTLLASLTAQAAALQQLRSTGRIPADAEGFDYARFSELVDLAGHQAFAHEYEA